MRKASTPGSNSSTDRLLERRVIVGRVGRPRGLEGEVYVRSESDTPDRFRAGAGFLTDEASPRTLRVAKSRYHDNKMLVKFAEIIDRNAAESLRGVALTINAEERRSLNEDEFWPDELIGLKVLDPDGLELGKVIDVVVDGPQVQLVVDTEERQRSLVPFVRDLVPEVRVADGVVVVNPIEGLFSSSPD